MSFHREYAYRPPIPTTEQIMEDFDSARSKEFKDPVFNLPEDEFSIRKNGKCFKASSHLGFFCNSQCGFLLTDVNE